MFNPSKCDPDLGRRVEAHLRSLNLHTPSNDVNALSDDSKVAEISKHFKSIMDVLGLDLTDDSLSGTPKRVADMLVRETMWGLDPDKFPKMMAIENKMQYDEMLIERGIEVMSQCEHHFVTIEGKCHIAYIPDKKVAGLSKFNRIVEYFSRRPQVQERLTAQIFETLRYLLETDNVAVIIEARHYCVISRGVEDQSSDTVSNRLGGVFREPQVKAELFAMLRK